MEIFLLDMYYIYNNSFILGCGRSLELGAIFVMIFSLFIDIVFIETYANEI